MLSRITQELTQADTPFMLLIFNTVPARTLVLQAFQNALFLYELFPSSGGMTEGPIIFAIVTEMFALSFCHRLGKDGG